MPRAASSTALTTTSHPYRVPTRSPGDPSRTHALTTPENPTATSDHDATTENRGTATDQTVSPLRRSATTSTAIAPRPPTHSDTPTRCRNIAPTASEWPADPAACPVDAWYAKAASGSTHAHRAPTAPRTASATAEVTAASTTITSPMRPSSISVRYCPSPAPKPGASSRVPETAAYCSTSPTTPTSAHTAAATPAVVSAVRCILPGPTNAAAVTSAPRVRAAARLLSASATGCPQRTRAPGSVNAPAEKADVYAPAASRAASATTTAPGAASTSHHGREAEPSGGATTSGTERAVTRPA